MKPKAQAARRPCARTRQQWCPRRRRPRPSSLHAWPGACCRSLAPCSLAGLAARRQVLAPVPASRQHRPARAQAPQAVRAARGAQLRDPLPAPHRCCRYHQGLRQCKVSAPPPVPLAQRGPAAPSQAQMPPESAGWRAERRPSAVLPCRCRPPAAHAVAGEHRRRCLRGAQGSMGSRTGLTGAATQHAMRRAMPELQGKLGESIISSA